MITAATLRRIDDYLARRLSPARYEHSLAVAASAADLAELHGESSERARMAGLMHDLAREIPPDDQLRLASEHRIPIDSIEGREPLLLHGKVGAVLARSEFGVTDGELLAAIATHITGAPGMSRLQQLIFLADFIAPGRTYPEVDQARLLAVRDLRAALVFAYDSVIRYVLRDGYLLHPRTVLTRNELIETGVRDQDR